MAINASAAQAEPVGYQFDRGVINLGGSDGTWAPLIDPAIPDPPASLTSEVAADGTLTANASDFSFPPKRIENLATGDALLPFADANILITAEGPITGSFDTESGSSSLVIPADVLITIYRAGEPTSMARCRVDGFNLMLETTGSMSDPGDPAAVPPRPAAEYDAAPFAQPPSSEGAMIASWASLPAAEIISGAVAGLICPKLDTMLGGPGGAWMAGTGGTGVTPPPQPAPTLAPVITGTPASSTTSKDATFVFSTSEDETSQVTGFRCRLDAGAFEPCDAGTQTYTGLAEGSHAFEVKAVNDHGEGPVAPHSWQITGTTIKKKAKLDALKVSPKEKAVKAGKQAVFTIKINNSGDAAATGVKVCVSAPKKLVKTKKCMTIGKIAARKTATRKFKATVTKTARKGKKLVLKFKASSGNAGAKNAKATIKVK